jgi:hypothetical protein
MIVKSLDKMEEIVRRNRFLFWDGWTVVHLFQSDKGRTSKFGARVKGKWFIQKRIVPDKDGWTIPESFVR